MKNQNAHHLRKSYDKWANNRTETNAGIIVTAPAPARYSRRLSRRIFAAVKKANKRDN